MSATVRRAGVRDQAAETQQNHDMRGSIPAPVALSLVALLVLVVLAPRTGLRGRLESGRTTSIAIACC